MDGAAGLLRAAAQAGATEVGGKRRAGGNAKRGGASSLSSLVLDEELVYVAARLMATAIRRLSQVAAALTSAAFISAAFISAAACPTSTHPSSSMLARAGRSFTSAFRSPAVKASLASGPFRFLFDRLYYGIRGNFLYEFDYD